MYKTIESNFLIAEFIIPVMLDDMLLRFSFLPTSIYYWSLESVNHSICILWTLFCNVNETVSLSGPSCSKASLIFSTKNISVFGYKVVKHFTS